MNDIKKIQEFFSKSLNEATFKVGDKVTYLGHPAEITKVNKEMTGAITYNVAYDKGDGRTKATNLSNKGGEIKPLNENKPVANVNRHIKAIQIQLDQLGVKYEMSGNPYKPFKAVYKPINKDDKWYNNFEDIVFRYNLGGVVKSSIKENISQEVVNKVSRFITLMANYYDFSEQDAVYAIMQALRAHKGNFQGLNEAKSISDYKIGDIISFKDGEDWKVMKVKDNIGKLVIKPHNEKAKKGNVSLEIDIDADYLKNNLSEDTLEEDRFADASLEDLEQVVRNLAHTAGMGIEEAAEMAMMHIEDMFMGGEELEEDLDLGHQDNEPHMLKADLYRIGKYAMELYQMVDQFEGPGEVDFPHWWQAKIIKAKDYLVGAKHYLDFETKEPEIDTMLDKVEDMEVFDNVGVETEDELFENKDSKYTVIRTGGSVGDKSFKKEFDSEEKAKEYAKRMNNQLSPGEKKYYKIKYKVIAPKNKPVFEEKTLAEKIAKQLKSK